MWAPPRPQAPSRWRLSPLSPSPFPQFVDRLSLRTMMDDAKATQMVDALVAPDAEDDGTRHRPPAAPGVPPPAPRGDIAAATGGLLRRSTTTEFLPLPSHRSSVSTAAAGYALPPPQYPGSYPTNSLVSSAGTSFVAPGVSGDSFASLVQSPPSTMSFTQPQQPVASSLAPKHIRVSSQGNAPPPPPFGSAHHHGPPQAAGPGAPGFRMGTTSIRPPPPWSATHGVVAPSPPPHLSQHPELRQIQLPRELLHPHRSQGGVAVGSPPSHGEPSSASSRTTSPPPDALVGGGYGDLGAASHESGGAGRSSTATPLAANAGPQLSPGNQRRLFVGNLRFEMTFEGLRHVFKLVCNVDVPVSSMSWHQSKGPVAIPDAQQSPQQQHSGCAVVFADPAAAEELLVWNQRIFCCYDGTVYFGPAGAMREVVDQLRALDVDPKTHRRKGPKNCMVIELSAGQPPLPAGAIPIHPLSRDTPPAAISVVPVQVGSLPDAASNGSFGHGAAAGTVGRNSSAAALGESPVSSFAFPVSAQHLSQQLQPNASQISLSDRNSAISSVDAFPRGHHHRPTATTTTTFAGPPPPFYQYPLQLLRATATLQAMAATSTPSDPLLHSAGSHLRQPVDLFIGGLAYEADPAFVAWMLTTCCPGLSVSLDCVQLMPSKHNGNPSGCAIVTVEQSHAETFLGLNKRILCTSTGFYLSPQRDAMDAFIAAAGPAGSGRAAGPSHAVVVERKKSDRKSAVAPSAPHAAVTPASGFFPRIMGNFWPPPLPCLVQPILMPFSTATSMPTSPPPPPDPRQATPPSAPARPSPTYMKSTSTAAPPPSIVTSPDSPATGATTKAGGFPKAPSYKKPPSP